MLPSCLFVRHVSLLALLFLTSCAQQPFSSVDRSKYKTVALNREMKVAKSYVYHDITGNRSRGMFGLVGAVIGATSEAYGLQRFDAVASKNSVDIRGVMYRHMESALKTSPMKLVATNADTTLTVEIWAYGVGPVSGRQLGGVIMAKATLVGRDGQSIWKKDEWATSNTTALLEGLEQNPKLWPQMANEAAEALAKKLVLYTNQSERQVAQPLM